MKIRKCIIYLSVVLIILVLISLSVLSFLTARHFTLKYYSDVSNYEWIELDFYSGTPQKNLGKYPDNIFCNVYSLKGIAQNELLYLDGSDVVGFGSNGYTKIILNEEFEEPVKTLSIKEIVITESDNSTIKIEDKMILNQIEQMFKNQNGNSCDFLSDQFNTSVYFDVGCDLFWSCFFEKRTDGSIHLIGYDQKEFEFRDYNVTDILDGYI